MPFSILKQKLTSRGYWSEADSDGGASGGSGEQTTDLENSDETDQPGGEQKADDKEPQMSDKEAQLLKDLMKQKAKNKDAEKTLAELKAQLKGFEGVDLEQFKLMTEERKQSEQKKLEEKGNWDALKKQMVEENQKVVSQHVETINELKAQLAGQESLINKLTMGNAFSHSNFILNEMNMSPEKVRILFGDHFELSEGKLVAFDKPKSESDRVQLVDASGEFLNFEEAIRKIVESDSDKDRLLKNKVKVGSSSTTTNTKLNTKVELRGVNRIAAGLSQNK
jgi:hypothetical protein